MDTLELSLELEPIEPWSGILIAQLSELGFDGFLETKKGIKAYAPANIILDEVLGQTCLQNADFKFKQEVNIIPEQNWNAAWESDFEPVFIEDKATILAPFHDESLAHGLKLLINPQMSFGTGHHETTWLMTRQLFTLGKIPSRVLDMGSGTGILAIVAEKLGADFVLAVDIEEWAVNNAIENVALNACERIHVKKGDIDMIANEEPFGLILANINRNVLINQMETYSKLLVGKGKLLLSGFFTIDRNDLNMVANQYGLFEEEHQEREGWCMIQLSKK